MAAAVENSENAALIALGANLASPAGTPRETLEAALASLAARGIALRARSAWYRSPAWPPGSGPDFVNGAAALTSTLAPAALLGELHAVEQRLGRVRGRRWAARACDLDLLAVDALVLPDAATVGAWMALAPEAQARQAPPALILPHPRLHDRGFVLAPLAEIAAQWRHPLLGLSVGEMLAALPPAALAGIERL